MAKKTITIRSAATALNRIYNAVQTSEIKLDEDILPVIDAVIAHNDLSPIVSMRNKAMLEREKLTAEAQNAFMRGHNRVCSALRNQAKNRGYRLSIPRLDDKQGLEVSILTLSEAKEEAKDAEETKRLNSDKALEAARAQQAQEIRKMGPADVADQVRKLCEASNNSIESVLRELAKDTNLTVRKRPAKKNATKRPAKQNATKRPAKQNATKRPAKQNATKRPAGKTETKVAA